MLSPFFEAVQGWHDERVGPMHRTGSIPAARSAPVAYGSASDRSVGAKAIGKAQSAQVIELNEDLHNLAVSWMDNAATKIHPLAPFLHQHMERLHHGDFTDMDIFGDVIARADVLFSNNMLFDTTLNGALWHIAEKHTHVHACLVTTKPACFGLARGGDALAQVATMSLPDGSTNFSSSSSHKAYICAKPPP